LVCISQAGLELASGGVGALLFSQSNVEKVYMGWGLRVLEFWFFVFFFSAKCGSSISAKFLIYGAYAVCFLPVLAILDSPKTYCFFVVILFSSYLEIYGH
jgi:hypothetical protein